MSIYCCSIIYTLVLQSITFPKLICKMDWTWLMALSWGPDPWVEGRSQMRPSLFDSTTVKPVNCLYTPTAATNELWPLGREHKHQTPICAWNLHKITIKYQKLVSIKTTINKSKRLFQEMVSVVLSYIPAPSVMSMFLEFLSRCLCRRHSLAFIPCWGGSQDEVCTATIFISC